MDDWREMQRKSLRTPAEIATAFDLDIDEVRRIGRSFKTLITPYYAGLIKTKGDPLYRQVVPDPAELAAESGVADPLAEDHDSPVPSIVHRYPASARSATPARSTPATSRTAWPTSRPTRRSATSSSPAATRSC